MIKRFWQNLLHKRQDWDSTATRNEVSAILAGSGLDYPQAKVIMQACKEDYASGDTSEDIIQNAKELVNYALKQIPKRGVYQRARVL